MPRALAVYNKERNSGTVACCACTIAVSRFVNGVVHVLTVGRGAWRVRDSFEIIISPPAMQKLIPQKSFFAKTMKRKFDMSVEGFSVKCKDDEVVIVTPIQAGKLHENCEYFRTVFEHGTTEAHSGTIIKPDWSSVTTKRLIELITMVTVSVKVVAANQDLYDFLFHSLLQGTGEAISTKDALKLVLLAKSYK